MKLKHKRHKKGIAFGPSTRRVQSSHGPGFGVLPFSYPWAFQQIPQHVVEGSPEEEAGESPAVEAAEMAAGIE